MASTYTGLYIQRLDSGAIFNIQVIDTAGNSNTLSPEEYIERNVNPPIEQLPNQEDYNSNR